MSLSKILHYGFLIFVFLLPFQTVFLWREPFIGGVKWQYGTIGLYATDILLAVLLTGVLVGSILNRFSGFRIVTMKFHLPILLFIFWVGMSIFWAQDTWLACSVFIAILLASNVFLWARLLDQSMIRKIIFVLLAVGVLQSGVGIAQFLSQQSWNSTLLGMGTHEVWQPGSSVLKVDGERILRAYGTFPHPNMLGGFLAVIFVSSIAYLVLGTKELEIRAGSKYQLALILYLSSLIIILLGLILTFSRTAWLGAGLGIATLFLWSFLSSDTRKLRPWFSGLPVKMLAVLAGAGIVFVSVLQAQVFPRFDRATIEYEGSVSERVQSLYDAKTVMDATPLLFGTGAGNFTETLLRLTGERPVWTLQPVHNVVVLILAEIGVIGLFLWFVFLGTILLSWKKYLTLPRKEPVRAIFALALLVLLPSLFLDHWLWSSHFGIFFSFLLLGLSHNRDEESV